MSLCDISLCDICGECLNIDYSLKHESWKRITNDRTGILCLNCLLSIADKNYQIVTADDFVRMWIWNDLSSFTIIDTTGIMDPCFIRVK